MLPAIAFPVIDPVAIAVGPFAVRWYALAYIAGILIGWRYCLWLARRQPVFFEPQAIDDFVLYATIGIVAGGRIGYVFFYNLPYFVEHPLEAFMIWKGGMSFHGGLIGVLTAIGVFARRVGAPYAAVGDIVAAATPIGLFFGRIANFVNGELFGRPAPDVPWAMVFPRGGPQPRHPSQFYEAALEGLVLFAILFLLARREGVRRRPGLVGGVFLVGYGLFRSFGELFREPDVQIGYLAFGFTMGQLLSLPMVVAGLAIIVYACSRPPMVPSAQR